MKKVLYKTDKDLENRLKTMSILQEIEDEETTTIISKSFEYQVDDTVEKEEERQSPKWIS